MAFSRRLAAVGSAVAGALAAIGLALIGLAHGVSAAPGTARAYPGLTPPCNTTLQACISGSAPGDQVNLAAGTYITTIVITKAVSLIGASAATTIIQPHADGLRAVVISGTVPPSTQIAFLTVQGARLASGNGAGVLVEAPAQPNLHDLAIITNTVSGTHAIGGGLFTSSNLTLTRVIFRKNSAVAGSGGALGSSPAAQLTLLSVSANSNTANERGGAVFAQSAVVSNSNFFSNVTTLLQGGAVYLTGTAAISNSTFHNNVANNDGGGVYAGGDASVSGGAYFSNASTIGNAGAIYAGGSLAVKGSFISGNQAFDSGGAVLAGSALTMTDALIAENASTGGSGAGVRVVGTAFISGTQFISNTAFNPGGGMRASLDVRLINSTFVSNTSGVSGGGLHANAGAAISGGSFIANAADHGGGALVSGTASLTGTLFSGNQALFSGGGLEVITATVRGATFERNRTLDGNGGGLHARNHLTLRDSQFTANEVVTGTSAAATGSGGGVFSDGVLTSTNNTFIGNFAHRLGGGMDADDLRSTGDIFRGNGTGPQGSGGGMFVAQAFGIDGAQFYTNGANTAGGLGINSTASGFVINSLFARNTVTFTDGGSAIRLLSNSGVQILHNTLVGVSQPGRAAIHVQSASGSHALSANIFTQHARGIQNFSSVPTTTLSADHNLFFTVPVTGVGVINWGSQNIVADPAFANPAQFDFHLLPHSPAIDATPSYGVSNDFEKQPRPMGINFDIGFDEALPPRLYLPLIVR